MDTTHTRRILVVDDDPLLVASLTDGLELAGGYLVFTAPDGATGLQQCLEVAPDCIVVDVRMPSVNGYQFVRALRGDPSSAEIPIIVLSALVQDQEQLYGLLSGADAYLLKPVALADLLDAIDEAVHLSPQERALRVQLLSDSGELN